MEKDEFFINLDKENEFRVSLTCLSDLKNSTDQFSNLDQLIRKTWQTKMHEEEGNFRYKMIPDANSMAVYKAGNDACFGMTSII